MELHEEFNKQIYNHQTNSHQDSFYMSISEHRNGLASTIEFTCNRKKQDKRLNNHHFPLHLPQQTKHDSGDPAMQHPNGTVSTSYWPSGCSPQEGGKRINKALGNAESTLVVIWKKIANIEAYADMAERLMIDLAI